MENKTENRIVETCLQRTGNNLAAILIFGSYNTKNFALGDSDINLIILFKKKNEMKFQATEDILKHKDLADLKISITHFRTLEDYKEHIYKEGTWASWITIIKGSKIIYSTKEFEEFRKYLESHPIPNRILKEYLEHKDEIELEGYFTRLVGWNLTKAYFSHMRRKLQIFYFITKNKIEFDYDPCLQSIKDTQIKNKLITLNEHYKNRRELTKSESADYCKIAKQLTSQITKLLEDNSK